MKTEAILAGVATADIEAAIRWYTTLLGRGHDERPMNEAAEWRLANGGGIQLVQSRDRAGKSMVTIGVADIEKLVDDLASRGVETQATARGQGPYRLAQVTDPEGNLLTFSQDQRKH
jgi:catechol 2,3-dioxygenase-like lactoylglutathione lyase family enzyme